MPSGTAAIDGIIAKPTYRAKSDGFAAVESANVLNAIIMPTTVITKQTAASTSDVTPDQISQGVGRVLRGTNEATLLDR